MTPERSLRIGLTYDLRDDYLAEGFAEDQVAEFDRAETIVHIEEALQSLGHETDRIGHVRALAGRLVKGDRWDLVFNVAEGVRGFGREAEVPALLEAYGIPHVFSEVLTCALTLHKGMTKRVLRDLGLPTPDFALVERPEDIASVDMPFPLFVKPVAEGTSKGIGPDALVHDAAALRRGCLFLLERFGQPVLVERWLPGRELTVCVLGTGDKARVVGVMDVVLLDSAEPGIYTYLNKEESETRVHYRLVEPEIAAAVTPISLAAWRGLLCRDGGRVDLRADEDGHFQILELNPLPGMHAEHSDLPITWSLTGRRFVELVGEILESALERVEPSRAGQASRAEGGGTG